jgi:hypothetical protein
MEIAMAEQWRVKGDFVDFCRCSIPCPCTFGQAPSDGECDGIIAWHVREGTYGDVQLDGLNVAGVARFVGNIWDPDVTAAGGFILDEAAGEDQREALMAIFGGQAGGWPGLFAQNFSEILGVEVAPIELEIDDSLESWSINIPGKAGGSSQLLTGPTSTPGQRLAVHNAPGAEVGPGQGAVTYGVCDYKTEVFDLDVDRQGRSSKHIPFEWSSEDDF